LDYYVYLGGFQGILEMKFVPGNCSESLGPVPVAGFRVVRFEVLDVKSRMGFWARYLVEAS
jgi:hypothetical protein